MGALGWVWGGRSGGRAGGRSGDGVVGVEGDGRIERKTEVVALKRKTIEDLTTFYVMPETHLAYSGLGFRV
jgi:hypothetical protein